MRNTQIEWLWVEVGSQFVCAWQAFFTHLENLHYLQRDNPHHIWLLHYIFLSDIKADCKHFQDEWNSHPISSPNTHHWKHDTITLNFKP